MRRAMLLGPAVVAALLCVFLFMRPVATSGQVQSTPANGKAAGPQLPIAQVVLFSSGVGMFQREGTIDGNARIDLTFPVQDINDLLKSMVLRDLDGGHIAAVSYDSNAPAEKTLKSFAINLNGNPSFAAVLNQARGEKVEVSLGANNAAQPAVLTGSIVGVEKQKAAAGKDTTVEIDVLNLWCADGMRAVKLVDVPRIRFLNPVIESEFRKALDTLTQTHDTQKKAVSISCAGEGQRRVRVGYVVENPIWKTSYRLVLAKEKDKKPYLQGWAVVENPSDEDWKDVRIALVSGRPISFQMDLYQPLFVNRPTVELELFASLRPVAYSGGLEQRQLAAAAPAPPMEEAAKALRDAAPDAKNPYYSGIRANAGYSIVLRRGLDEKMNLAQGVQSAASAAKLGDFFQYLIDKPVSLPRQKSALLPIAANDIEGTRVSIYNERTQPKFPLLGLKLKNTSGLHLMQGPITVFDGSSYAGDARIMDLQPNEERLISFAIDLGTEVNPVASSDNGRLTAIKAVNGVLHTTTKVRERKAYTIVNRNGEDRLVLLEHPVRNEFKLIDTDKPAETASDVYRFEVKVPAGKTVTQTITEEHVIGQTVQLTGSDDNQMRFFISQPTASAKLKQALGQAVEMKVALQKTQRDIQEQQRQLDAITQDQGRLRANLKEMPATAAAYKRYLEKFDQQETQIEKYQAEIKKLQGQEHEQRKGFEAFLAGLTVE